MRVEFTVPMEGPRTALHPKGISRRPGHSEDVPDDEGARLIERGMAIEVDADGYPVKITTAEHANRQAEADQAAADQLAAEQRAAAEASAADQRQAPVERTVTTPAKPVERAVTQPTPAKPGAPKGATGGKAAKTADQA